MIATVEVTDSDIEHGRKSDCYQCPIAIAINRHLASEYECAAANPGVIFLRVDVPVPKRNLRWDDFKNGYPFHLPREAKLWMWDYDKGNFCYPFTFKVELPSEVLA